MKKSTLITLVDIGAFISFVFVVSTGVLMRYSLPPRSGRFIEILGLSRHEWGEVHFYISFLFLLILSMHLILHWRFILGVLHGRVREISSYRLLLGVLALTAVLALAIAPFVTPKEDTGVTTGYQYGKENK
ncbi:DUF4405 domain-containing protein [Sulfuriflexus mobilis]|uniref:DUF4405 domain-containing protein n=1 Tax=Sulfuriflexus mobilis TaxID=1811807 RepID=UPI0015593478|nr:DUF4405 domain-containing protein [Sulfuriflexus mobilis]